MMTALSGRYTSLTMAILLVGSLTLGGADLRGAPPDRFGDPLPEGALARLGTTRFRAGLAINSCRAVFSPDGKTIASAGDGLEVCLWDAGTGRLLRRVGKYSYGAGIAFSPDGKRLACDARPVPALFDVASGVRLNPLAERGVGFSTASVSFAPDGKVVAVANRDGGFNVWDVDSRGKSRRRFDKRELDIHCVAFSPDGKVLASAGRDTIIRLWDPATGRELARLKGHERQVLSVVFSPDGKRLVSADEDHIVRQWDVVSRKLLRVLDGRDLVWKRSHPDLEIPKDGLRARATVAFSRDGKLLATGHGEGTIILWDAARVEEIRRWHAHHFTPASLDFSPDGKTLLSTAYCESGPRLWDVATGKEKLSFAGHHAAVGQLSFSADGKSLFSLGHDMELLRWDLERGREAVGFRHPDWALDDCRISPGGEVLATWEPEGRLQLRGTRTGKTLHTLGSFRGRGEYSWNRLLLPLDFSADGKRLAFGLPQERTVVVWDVHSGEERQRLSELQGFPMSMAFSPDGKRIAIALGVRCGQTLALWDVASGKKLADLSGQEDNPGTTLAFSPDGKVLAAGDMFGPTFGPIHLWDTATGHELRSLRSAFGVIGLAFSPDGKWLAAGGGDEKQEIHVWEVSTGLEVRSFDGQHQAVLSIAFSPDGRSLATGGMESMILLWDFTGRRTNRRRQPVQWTNEELEQRWNDLASRDGPKAVQAIWDLADSPEQAMPLLRQRVKPARQPDAERLRQWIRDLDSDDFPTRTAATKELEAIVEQAEPALRKALADNPGLEARRRIEQVLQKRDPLASPERLRTLRAIQVLEYAGTPEARRLLRELAEGVAGARLSREAREALRRISQR